MIFFDKKIIYLDYIEYGNRIKSAGFIKIEVRDTECRLQVKVQSLYQTDTMRCDIMLMGTAGSYLLDSLMLHSGTGTYFASFQTDNIGGSGWSYQEVTGLRIPISESRYLKAEWETIPKPIEEKPTAGLVRETEPNTMEEQSTAESVKEVDTNTMEERSTTEPVKEVDTNTMEEKSAAEPVRKAEIKSMQEEMAMESTQEDVREPESWGMEEADKWKTCPKDCKYRSDAKANPTIIYDDKWKQLEQVYPKIHPFGNEKEYLSIEPKDFIVLTGNYQHLANNSFLLHGFYNYRHIILGKISEEHTDGQEDKYYIGVPGAFYEREKMVAVMFGFESFESAEEPAEQGTFGYYMKRVEI